MSVLLVAYTWTQPTPDVKLKAPSPHQSSSDLVAGTETAITVNAQDPSWGRLLRRPLYDPPPPPKVVIKKKVRPITVKLTGTILEGENSQAFLRRANGKVELKRVGDLLTEDPLDGLIEKITATSITIRRDDEEIQLEVENQN